MQRYGKPAKPEEEESERRLEETLLAEPQKPNPKPRKPHPHWYGKHPLEWAVGALLFLTLLATGAAAFYTSREVCIMRDQETRQLRAYLFFPQDNAVTIFQAPSTHMTLELQVAVKNIGITPAFDVVGESWVYLMPWPIPHGFIFPRPKDPNGNSSSIVAPGEIVEYRTGSARPMTAQEMQLYQNGMLALYIYGSVSYDDALGNERYTNFCLANFGAPQGPYATTTAYCQAPYNDAN